MTKRTQLPLIHCLDTGADAGGVATGVVTIDVLAAEPQAKAETGPVWIKLSPRGRFTARDGRSFEVVPEQLVERFSADAVDVPIDLDHATVKKAIFGDAAPALAWIKELAARPDGLYGKVEWLAFGLTTLAAKTHRYISPSFKAGSDGVVTWLHSAALVAAPALSMPAVASADPNAQEHPMLNKIAAALGLNPSADEAACLSAIATLSERVEKSVHDQTLQTLTATTKELNDLKAEQRGEKVKALLDEALESKKIVPAQRAHYETLCASDEGLKGVEELLKATAAGLGASGLDGKKPADQVATLSVEDREIMTSLGFTEEEYRKANGLTPA